MSQDSKDPHGKLTKKSTKVVRPRFNRDIYGCTATEDEVAQALASIDISLGNAGLGDSRFVHHMMLNFNHVVMTTDLPTMATQMFADGDKAVMINPQFTNSLETDADRFFIIYHECLHWLQGHLHDHDMVPKDQTWTYAQEIIINAVILARRGTGRMPHTTRINKAGNLVAEPTGIDPREVYAKTYVKGCEEAGISPVSYEKFTESERSCYSELMRLPEPPGSQGNPVVIVCDHQDPSGSGGEDGQGPAGGSGPSLDDELMDEVVKGAIQATVTDAKNGSERAREEILKLAEVTEEGNEKAKQLWGSYGIMGLRGQTDATRTVEWWQQWVLNALASRLMPGDKLIFPKKRSAMLMALGYDITPVRRGEELHTRLACFLDTSGSVPSRVVDAVAKLVGRIPGVEVDWFMFDGTVERLVPGEAVKGGGGTDFQNCVDVAEGRREVDGELVEDYDCHLMITDGIAPHVSPDEPDKWIWLIMPGNNEWPDDPSGCGGCHPEMSSHIVDFEEAALSA